MKNNDNSKQATSSESEIEALELENAGLKEVNEALGILIERQATLHVQLKEVHEKLNRLLDEITHAKNLQPVPQTLLVGLHARYNVANEELAEIKAEMVKLEDQYAILVAKGQEVQGIGDGSASLDIGANILNAYVNVESPKAEDEAGAEVGSTQPEEELTKKGLKKGSK